MESTLSSPTTPFPPCFNSSFHQKPMFQLKASAASCTNSVLSLNSKRVKTGSVGNTHICRSGYHSSFCYDKSIPEEIIEKPVVMLEKNIGNNPRCSSCEAKGATPCATCSGSGLYIDSIMESQGIIVKVRCLGCGGTGNTMCSQCGGWGHL